MIDIYMTNPTNGALSEQEKILPGSWVHLCDPTPEEIGRVSSALSIDRDFLMAALDEEERSRLDIEDGNTLVLVDTPTVETQGPNFVYNTLPFGIILTEDNIVTVCLKEVALPRAFTEGLVKGLNTRKKNRMTLQLLYRNATLFLFYLRQVDKNSTRVENELHISMKNKELIQMLGLEKSLVYFSTSLKSNELTLEKILRGRIIKLYEDDQDLLEDVLIEIKQAIEMCNIYSGILSGTMDAFASIISNNLNIVMKILAAVTIVMAIPNIVFGFYGMNVVGFGGVTMFVPIAVTLILMALSAVILAKLGMFK